MAEQRRSMLPQAGSGLARRAPSPSSAAFSSSRPNNGGPLGGYRPASRDGSERPMSRSGEASTSAPGTASRFGFASTSAAKSGTAKRTLSSAGLRDPQTPGPSGSAPKKALLTSASATPAASPRFPHPSPSYDASVLKTEYERRELLSKQAYEKLQGEYQASGREIEKFKQERLALLRQWEEANTERQEEKQSFEEQRKFLNERVSTLTQQTSELKRRLDVEEKERNELAKASHGEETKQSLRITTLEYELATARAQAEEHKEARAKMELSLSQKERDWDEERIRLRRSSGEGQDSKQLTQELSELLIKIHKLEGDSLALQQDNRTLKARSESIEALKEQNRDLEDRLDMMSTLRREHAEAQANIKALEAEKLEWVGKLSDGGDVGAFEKMQQICSDAEAEVPSVLPPNPMTVGSLPQYLSTLQGALSGLSVRSSALADRVRGLRQACDEAERAAKEHAEQAKSLEEQLNSEKSERFKQIKIAEAGKMEVESYVKLLDTFQEEARSQSTQFNEASAEHIQLLEARLKTMETSLSASTKEADELRKLTQGAGGISKEERQKLVQESEAKLLELQKALDESRKESAELEKQCVELGKMNDSLFLRVGRGEFDQSQLRCLELKDNPISKDRVIRTSTLDALRKENQELLEQVEELSKRVASSGDDVSFNSAMVPVQTLENQKKEYEKLEQAMRNRDKAFERLKEAFAAKAIEYVAAVKALFGYDMHVISRGKVKIRSVYARTSKGTSLTFESADEGNVGNMKLVGEARQGIAVGNLQEYWLGSDRFSVPCFLAALQLELYEGTTRAVRGTWEAEEKG